MYERKIFVSDELIRGKAKRVQILYIQQNPEDFRVDLKFNSGWLEKLKARNKLKSYKSHGKSGNVDLNVINSELPKLQGKLQNYAFNDIWNADEFRPFLIKFPNSINCNSSNSWSKSKARITCLACANAEGSEKMLFVIGKSINPRCSNGKTPYTLKISYKSSPRAWMN